MSETRIRDILINLNREHLAVMQAVARGMTYQEIAESLSLSQSTVKRRVGTVMTALGVESRIEALLLLSDAKLIDVNDESWTESVMD